MTVRQSVRLRLTPKAHDAVPNSLERNRVLFNLWRDILVAGSARTIGRSVATATQELYRLSRHFIRSARRAVVASITLGLPVSGSGFMRPSTNTRLPVLKYWLHVSAIRLQALTRHHTVRSFCSPSFPDHFSLVAIEKFVTGVPSCV